MILNEIRYSVFEMIQKKRILVGPLERQTKLWDPKLVYVGTFPSAITEIGLRLVKRNPMSI